MIGPPRPTRRSEHASPFSESVDHRVHAADQPGRPCRAELNAEQHGAGLFVTETTSLPNVAITNTTYSGKMTEADGGAIYVEVGTASLGDCTVTMHTTGNNGGSVCCTSSAVSFASTGSITQNTAATGTGGGICQQTATVSVNGASVRDNDPDNCLGLVC